MVNPTIRGANPLTRKVGGRVYSYSHCVGRAGGGETGFTQPVDVAVAPGGATYVLNRSPEFAPSSRVSKVTIGSSWGEEEFILVFGSHGPGDGEFQRTTALALDKDENVYVADEWHNRISIFDKDGNFLEKWGTSGAGKGELARPWGIKLDRDDNLWVVDSANHRVQAFTKDGKFLDAWGQEGVGEGEFREPWGIWIDNEGDVYVSDWRNSRVQKFRPDGSYLMTFGGEESGLGALEHPSGVTVDDDGDVYVADWSAHRVVAYDPDGSYITAFYGDAQRLSKWAEELLAADPMSSMARRMATYPELEWPLCFPTGVFVDKRTLVIADQQRSRLQIYTKEPETWVEPQLNL